jgi:hypothetical protein
LWGAYVFLHYTIFVVEETAEIPFGSFEAWAWGCHWSSSFGARFEWFDLLQTDL